MKKTQPTPIPRISNRTNHTTFKPALTLFAAIMTRDYWAMFGTLCMNVGSIAVAYGVFKHETDKEAYSAQL